MTRPAFDALGAPRGALVVGSPKRVVEKILFQHTIFGHERFLAQISIGSLPHDRALRAIELFGTRVAPLVRDEVARRNATAA
jgi:alkanesulfonate monooxygenase SsuD/methylene tetrahydromethanopterin reductase-like flavin-dependent oxidoreductase (luciferase family)